VQRLACQPHSRLPQPLPLLELLLPPARSTQLGRVHCQRRCRRHFRHWCGQQGEEGGLASSRALLICSTPTRRAAQRACAARAAQSSHARARANVGSSPDQRHEAHTSWPAHTEAKEEGRRCRTERRMPTLRDTCAASAAISTPLRGSGAAHKYGTPF